MTRFERVIKIVDTAIDGPGVDIGVHGAFWHGITRDVFVAKKVQGLDLLELVNRFRFFGKPVTVRYASGQTVYKYSSDTAGLAASQPAADSRVFIRIHCAVAASHPTIALDVPLIRSDL